MHSINYNYVIATKVVDLMLFGAKFLALILFTACMGVCVLGNHNKGANISNLVRWMAWSRLRERVSCCSLGYPKVISRHRGGLGMSTMVYCISTFSHCVHDCPCSYVPAWTSCLSCILRAWLTMHEALNQHSPLVYLWLLPASICVILRGQQWVESSYTPFKF